MATRKATSPSSKQLQTMLRHALNDGRIVSTQYVDDVEEAFHPESNLGVARRLGLIQASKDGDFFKRVASERDLALVVAGQFDAVNQAVATLREVADVMERGLVRASLVVAKHSDMESILDEAKSHAVISPPSQEACHV